MNHLHYFAVVSSVTYTMIFVGRTAVDTRCEIYTYWESKGNVFGKQHEFIQFIWMISNTITGRL